MKKTDHQPGFEAVAGSPESRLLLLCDHASNHVPAEYHALGLPPAELERHIAYDIGARALTLKLAARFDAHALLTCHSRLLIDPNRGADDPTLIMKLSDGAIVPGNRNITEAERQKRIALFYLPYHTAITKTIDGMLASGITPLIVSLHSFTPFWKGVARPWHVGILWDTDRRIAGMLLDAFRMDTRLIVGDNEPYSGSLEGDTLNTHATKRGLPHALIEVRQDLLSTSDGIDEWVERLTKAITPCVGMA